MESFSAPIMCPIFIGRAPQRDALHRLIENSKNGKGQVALISGEAGIGKSRLVAEATAYTATQGFLLLQGNCFPTHITYPYAPLLYLLRSLLASHSATLANRHMSNILVKLAVPSRAAAAVQAIRNGLI